MTTLRLLAWAFVALCILPISATAQLDPVLTLTPGITSLSLGPSDTGTVVWVVSNEGATDGTVTLSVNSAPGWTFTLPPADQTFALPANNDRLVTVTVRPVAGPDPAAANAILSGRLTDAAGRFNDKTSQVGVQFVPAVVPPPPPAVPGADYTWAWVLGSVGVLALAAGGVYVFQARQVRLATDTPEKVINVGTDGWYGIRVVNRSGAPRNVHLRVGKLPAKWFAAFSFPTIKVAGGESVDVPLYVKVPLDASTPADVPISVSARPNTFSPWLAETSVSVRVVDVVPGTRPA
jgi:uncharacterized membrane protein